MRLLF
jgi:hypothetical protein